jgi:hypothetical protein
MGRYENMDKIGFVLIAVACIVLIVLVTKWIKKVKEASECVRFCRLWNDVCSKFLESVNSHICENDVTQDFDLLFDALNEIDTVCRMENAMLIYVTEYVNGKSVHELIEEKFKKVGKYLAVNNIVCDMTIRKELAEGLRV